MLNLLRMRLAYHRQAAAMSLRALISKPLSTLMTVTVLAISLTLPTLFLVFIANVKQLSTRFQQGGHISLYLESTTSTADETALLEQVRSTLGVSSASLTSAAEGLAELQQQEGMQDIMQYLPENPLPAVIDVVPSPDVNTSTKTSELYQVLKAYPHVEQAKVDLEWIERLYTLLDVATKMASGLMILLASAVVLIIGNTLRMAIHFRHEEIQVLTFIGAGKSYIIRPFLYLGVFYGIVSALVAMLLVHFMALSLGLLINQLTETWQMHYSLAGLSFQQAGLLLLSAMTLGWLGARLSVSSLCRAKFG